MKMFVLGKRFFGTFPQIFVDVLCLYCVTEHYLIKKVKWEKIFLKLSTSICFGHVL